MPHRLPIAAATVAALTVGALTVGALTVGATLPATAQTALDFGYYQSRVEPIFLKRRVGHTRCVVCHAESNNALRLEKLPDGGTAWTAEQSRHNFATVSTLVVPGDLAASRLLQHPLAPEAGGDIFHSGGRQFASKDDPDWKALAQWVNGAKPAAAKK
jgi:hypothetical protein